MPQPNQPHPSSKAVPVASSATAIRFESSPDAWRRRASRSLTVLAVSLTLPTIIWSLFSSTVAAAPLGMESYAAVPALRVVAIVLRVVSLVALWQLRCADEHHALGFTKGRRHLAMLGIVLETGMQTFASVPLAMLFSIWPGQALWLVASGFYAIFYLITGIMVAGFVVGILATTERPSHLIRGLVIAALVCTPLSIAVGPLLQSVVAVGMAIYILLEFLRARRAIS